MLPSARRAVPAAALAVCMMASMVVAFAPGATSSVTVTLDVASATAIDGSGCQSRSAATSLDVVIPGTDAVTSADCTVIFGSTNDTASLRLAQSDGSASAMIRHGWTPQASGYGSVLYDVHAADAQRAWAVGWSGTIRATSDGGSTWTAQASPQTSRAWWDIVATGPTTLHVVGAAGNIATTTDGTAWTAQPSGTTNDLYAVDFRTSQVGIAVGRAGTALVTASGATSWSATGPTGTSSHLYGVVHAAGAWIAVGGSSTILRSADDGTTWSAVAAPVAAVNLRAVRAADGAMWIVGDGGRVFRSVDGGATFTNVSSGTTENLDDLIVHSSTEVVVVGANGTIRRTRDGGATWSAEASGTSAWLRGAASGPRPAAWVVGEGGTISAYGIVASLPDYDATSASWASTGSMFGACLRSTANGAVTTASTWTPDAASTLDEPALDADCADRDADPWRPIVATSGASGSVVASTSAPQSTMTAEARLRFGAKAAPSLAPGAYAAELVFDVVAPAV